MDDTMTRYPFLEQAKIQALVVVPLLKAFQAEFGEERTNRVARKALGDWIRKAAEQMTAEVPGSGIDKLSSTVPFFTAGDALDVDVVKQDETELTFNVTGCRYAKFYKELGEPELGFLLMCSLDPPMTEAFPDLDFERTQTIMQGADHCDFRWALKKDPAAR